MEPSQAVSPSSDAPANLLSAVGSGRRASKRLKAPHEYSQNPNTLRVRQRNARLTPYQRALEQAKANDHKAIAAAWKERANTESFQEASPDEKDRILKSIEKAILDRRRLKGIDAESKKAALDRGMRPGENNPALASGAAHNNLTRTQEPTLPAPCPVMSDPMSATSQISPASQAAPASSSASTAVGNQTVQPASTSHASPVISEVHLETIAAIENLQEQLVAEKHRRREEIGRLLGELHEARNVMEDMRTQMQHMNTLLQTSYMPPPHYYPQPPAPPMQEYTQQRAFPQAHAYPAPEQYNYRYKEVDMRDYPAEHSENW
ncbi:hypothetical protein F5Y03DRAFT_275217 [Xylaria venustula]|nr:hypothetical protein F5Y03DRAFT_275217 [Xylaria venustula]